MRIVGLILTLVFLTSTAYAQKVEEKIVRTPGHTTIIYKDYSKKKEKAEPKAKEQKAEVEFREYNVGSAAPEPVPQPTRYTAQPAPVAVGPGYTQTYTPGPNRGMAANGGGTFGSGFLQTNGWGFPGYGFGPGYGPGFGPGYGPIATPYRGRRGARFAGPGFHRGFPAFGPGLVAVGIPPSFYGMPQQRFAPPPFIGAGYPVNGGLRVNFRGRGGGCGRY